MPTSRLCIKFSKTAFLNILKYAIKRAYLFVCNHGYTALPNQPTTFKFLQCSSGKTNPVKRSFQASWFTNRTWMHNDEANDLAFCHINMVAYKDG